MFRRFRPPIRSSKPFFRPILRTFGVIDSRTRETGILAGSESLSARAKHWLSSFEPEFLGRNGGLPYYIGGGRSVSRGNYRRNRGRNRNRNGRQSPLCRRWTRRLIYHTSQVMIMTEFEGQGITGSNEHRYKTRKKEKTRIYRSDGDTLRRRPCACFLYKTCPIRYSP